VAELVGQEARYAAMLTALQETVGQAVAETAASRTQLAAGEAEPASAAAATAAPQAHLRWDQIVFEMFLYHICGANLVLASVWPMGRWAKAPGSGAWLGTTPI
jgi:hypothetical protein